MSASSRASRPTEAASAHSSLPPTLPASSDLVFIGGTGRSGTHALAHLLGLHSGFADVPIEARFHCNKRGMPDLLEGRITLRSYLAKLRGFWWHRVRVDGQPRGLYNLLRRAELELALERFEGAYGDDPVAACRRQRPRWADSGVISAAKKLPIPSSSSSPRKSSNPS